MKYSVKIRYQWVLKIPDCESITFVDENIYQL